MIRQKLILAAVFFFLLVINSCKRDEIIITHTDYPKDIGYIFLSKCAVSGCHNDASYEASSHLNLSSWDKLFQGSSNGSTVIPFRSDFSSLLNFVNTYPDLGLIDLPTMPLHTNPLSREEVTRLKTWVTSGAPDKDGNVKFAGDPSRKKIYVVNQGCKVVTVFDAATLLPMRYINIADASEINTSPHQVKVSPDGQYWYVCSIFGSYIKRYRASDDSFDGKIFIGNASWNSMVITPDSKFLFAVDWSPLPGGKVVKCDLTNLTVIDSVILGDAPHGSMVSPDGKNLFITATGGNYLYKINVDSLSKPGSYEYVAFTTQGPGPSNYYNPHQIIFSPDSTKYFVSCSGTNNVGDFSVKVFDKATDNLIKSIPLQSGAFEMSISKTKNYLFVSSYDSSALDPHGNVAVIDLTSNSLIKYIATGVQPHGIAVDDAAGLVYVANRNFSNGIAPHHSSVCGGRNGNIVFIDLNTLQLAGKRIELSRDPYSVGIRY